MMGVGVVWEVLKGGWRECLKWDSRSRKKWGEESFHNS